ncbi:biotin-dependent carboxyltransferase family protein [Paenibacillus campi]|uniref:5-oxoprolinase subunit C family protein n=1 Tax=Paenibacillus campi TaxID=3106031 RepID=UPI002B002996|nr:biotin-dependent carboxyltransferase family protein [Paenibacillus sp. SGZ-1014]
MSIQIEKPGMLSTVQDMGRTGYARYGISTTGAMDTLAHMLANWLVGNDEAAATLEITWSGFAATVLEDSWIAITGGDLEPMLDELPLPMWRPVYVRKGSRIAFRQAINGCRAYIAIAGGWYVKAVLNSYSTYLKAGIGGLDGRALQAGDMLYSRVHISIMETVNTIAVCNTKAPIHSHNHTINPIQTVDGITADEHGRNTNTNTITKAMMLIDADRQTLPNDQPSSAIGVVLSKATHAINSAPCKPVRWRISSHMLPHYHYEVTIRIVTGRQWDDFDEHAQRHLLEQPYRVSPQSDRMGYRLTGAALPLKQPGQYLSEAVAHGTIQVPPDGQPIMLLADRQTLGGYAKIAQVISLDLPLLAQLAPGATVRFRLMELAEAQRLYVEWRQELKLLQRMIQLRLPALGLPVMGEKDKDIGI